MKLENKILKMSVMGTLFFALFGVAWGWALKSEMIMFDGMYSFISLFLSCLSLGINTYIAKKDFDKFPFGKHILEPIVVCVKSAVMTIMCVISLITSISSAINGGNEVAYGSAIIYSIVSVLGCAFVYCFMKNKSKKLYSEIIKVESTQWLMDTLLSGAVLVGFLFANVLGNTRYGYINNYVDPFMVIIASSIFIKVPIMTCIKSFKEIISCKADDEINDEIYVLVKGLEEEYKFEDSIVRVSKIGQALRIEIDFIYNKETKIKSLDDMDVLRERIDKRINHIKLKKWLNVSFTGDKKWAV